jgi:hypothetical protein
LDRSHEWNAGDHLMVKCNASSRGLLVDVFITFYHLDGIFLYRLERVLDIFTYFDFIGDDACSTNN